MNISWYKDSLRKKGWRFCLQEACKRLFRLRWVSNLTAMDQIYRNRAVRFLKRKYEPLLDSFDVKTSECHTQATKIIWICWLQGEKQSPNIVKRCIRSIRENAGDYEVRLITSENLSNYIDIPSYIQNRLHKHQMQYATYSDYIRTALLVKYGGVWIDATVLMTAPIPQDIANCPLFCFQESLSSSNILASSWFIISQPNNPILEQVKFLFEEYWEKESHLCDYYLFHLFVAIVVKHNDMNWNLWQEMPYWNNVDVHYVQAKLFEQFNDNCFQHICKKSFAHKLTYKFKDASKCQVGGTYYQHIMNS